MNFKEKKEPVMEIVFGLGLHLTAEDKCLLQNLIDSYFRKKKNFVNSKIKNIAGGLLWVYSRINFLFQYDNQWSQKSIAEKIDIEQKTVSRTASSMMDSLNIDFFDKRFAREDVAEKDPRNNFFMTQNGFILHKENLKEILHQRVGDKPDNILDEASEPDKNAEILNEPEKSSEKTKDKRLSEFFK